jgi:glycosyltransferase involved in cell wall biosynthesis
MRILLLADINSIHTQKWAIGLSEHGFKIGIFSFTDSDSYWYEKYNIECLNKDAFSAGSDSFAAKALYLLNLPKLRSAIKQFKPDVLHSHYASSYGLLGALSGFHPFVVSAWGTDLMRFPSKNVLNRAIIKYNLRKADTICATSHTLERYIHNLVNRKVEVIPFGVDISEFTSKKKNAARSVFTIGCIKALEKIYNINSLVIAFSYLKHKYPERKLKLVIIGDGSEANDLKEMVKNLGLSNDVEFRGKVPHEDIATCINEFDVFVNLSEYESFGVSVVEAMACGKPVIVSEAEGLKEVVSNERNGSIVNPNNIGQIVLALEKYMLSESLRETVGLNANQRVKDIYNWKDNLEQMIGVYNGFSALRIVKSAA